ncbi:MAG: IS66 family transposase [Piscinibacter sp.]|nr:IS66 family transposase [Piscinibacter sp.]
MSLDDLLERESDIEELRRVAMALHAQLQHTIRQLQRKCDQLAFYTGNKEELQQTLALIEQLTGQAKAAEEAAKHPRPKAAPKPRSKSGPTPQPDLPHVPLTCALDDADRQCPSCGGALKPMGDQAETSEMIDVVEVSYRIVDVRQPKYVCACGGCVETAPGPERALPGSRYSLAFAIKAVIDKYLDHIPLERQVRILERHHLVVTSQTLWDMVCAIAKRLARVDAALYDHTLAQPVMGLDQTGWPRLEHDAKKPWQMWCLTAPGVVVHRIRDDKSAATFGALVGKYRGTIVCDALATHAAGAREGPGITLAGCWAHVYRKFEEALPDHPEAEPALQWIGALYEIDRRADGDLARVAELRRAEAPAILDAFKDWLWHQATLKTLAIGKAAAYAVANWSRLTRFVDDARIPLDNNATERAIRGPVVGRKNHYGSKSRLGTQVAATLYTILETAKLHRLDPAQYLAAAVIAADRGETLLPWDFAAAAAAAPAATAAAAAPAEPAAAQP